MDGPSILRLSQPELLHLLEAASLLEHMTWSVERMAYLTVRDNGASWAILGKATGGVPIDCTVPLRATQEGRGRAA